MFNKEQKDIILKIAKDAIKEAVLGVRVVDRDELVREYPFLLEKGAVFVTINEFNNLRGCIGSIIAHRALVDDIIENAKSAALSDPRFKPLGRDELDKIEVEVSVLTPPKVLEYSDIDDLKRKIKPNVHGVILNYRGHQATYLPSVWEQLSDFDLFFRSLCQKAGLSGSCLSFHPDIYVYEAVKIGG